MPTYQSRVRQASEDAARQAAEDRFNEERRIYSEECRRIIRVQLDADKRKRENQQRLQKEERAQNRVQRTQESRVLSPTSSHMIAKRKSGSSIGERIVKGEGQSGCAGAAGSAKSPRGVVRGRAPVRALCQADRTLPLFYRPQILSVRQMQGRKTEMRVSRWRQFSDPDCGAFRTGWSPHSSSKATGRSFRSIGFAEAARAFPRASL
ncbi:hypothetical protein PILCRDRAFT_17344 [Piloderma croceum F 1598]|uniref:Uncharacterized protein n=1 Tax=Piloderma croceum (strain F 1598) TaxID=765440 RepID=A0A0C3B1N3_PILCF|nr:hypothetical protein PILCRDRAFT_17344 [Piloderma croceum F 1598]